jgi:hypothetical protein
VGPAASDPDRASDAETETTGPPRTGGLTLFVRYWLGAIMIFGGILCLIISPGGFGTEGFSMAVGAGLSVLMLNWLYRLGASGDREREQEEAAREYLERHGHWPDEAAPPSRSGRRPDR